ncbi:MAG: MFS transporter [Aggregatilineales bacterium]
MQSSTTSPSHSMVNRSPIYYGWVVWLVATVGLIATSPGQSFSVSLFFDPFIEEFELSRTAISSLYGAGTFIASLALVWIGRQIDRRGNRQVSTTVALLFAGALMLWSFVAGPLGLLFGFIAIRGLGQGSLSLSSSTVIAQWFKRRRGQVMSITLVLFALFQSQYILWLEWLLTEYTWREVWVILGVIVGVTVLPLSWLFIRNRPEDYGLLPDNDLEKPKTDIAQNADAIIDEESWTLSEARRTLIFPVFVLGRFLPSAWGTGMILHQVSIFAELGYEPGVATATFSQFTLMTAVVAIAGGWLVDHIRPGIVMALLMTGLVGAMGLTMVMTTPVLLFAYTLSFALLMGLAGVFDGAVWVNLFGRQYQGEIRGFVSTINVAGSALGPILFGLSFDLTGNYDTVLLTGIVLSMIPLVAGLVVKKPERRKIK